MRILIVSWYMPPFRTMGALRVGKLCKFLDRQGHDLRVLSCADLDFVRSVPVEIAEERILRTGSFDMNALPKAVQKLRVALRGNRHKGPSTVGAAAVPQSPPSSPSTPGAASTGNSPGMVARLLRAFLNIHQKLFNFPDSQIGWLFAALRGGRKILHDWQPDVIFVSAPPFTGLIVGRLLSRHCGAPLVVEYRDRYLEDQYWSPSRFDKKSAQLIEDWWMKDARAIVTVSEPWATDYHKRFGVPAIAVYNGFDPDDFPAEYPRKATDPEVLQIVYTGILYGEKRDPSPLFEAIALLGDEGRNVRVSFYGSNAEILTDMANRYGVLDRITINEKGVPYKDSIDLQMNADILLLLQWNNPKEIGNVPGKVFEYLGARRPVLGIGPEGGVPARILRERGAGVVVNDPKIIADHLRTWLAEKRAKGSLPLIDIDARQGYSRPEQFTAVENFLQQVAGPEPRSSI